jgi:hypothetical protein
MSIWSDDPEWFDEWIENRALDGRFGDTIKKQVEEGELPGYELWNLLSKWGFNVGELGNEACIVYSERFL